MGVFTAPRETFVSIVAHPRWLGVLVLTTLVGAGGMFAFVATPVGEQALLDEHLRRQESSGQALSPEAEAQFKQFAPTFKYVVPGMLLIVLPVFAFALAGLLFGYGAILGGGGTYKQVLAILCHAGVVTLLQAIVINPLNYVRQSLETTTNLTAFFPMVSRESFLGTLFSWAELFWIWQIILIAIGFSVLYRRRTAPIAWTLLGIYFGIALVVACYRSFVAGASLT